MNREHVVFLIGVAVAVFSSLAAFSVLAALKEELATHGVAIGIGLLALAIGGFLYMERGGNRG